MRSEYSSVDYPSLISTLLHLRRSGAKQLSGETCLTFQSGAILLITIMQTSIARFAFPRIFCAALRQVECIMSVISRSQHKAGEREAGGRGQTAEGSPRAPGSARSLMRTCLETAASGDNHRRLIPAAAKLIDCNFGCGLKAVGV